jgi:3-oxoacyl-[acyl-carrier protein] reductase
VAEAFAVNGARVYCADISPARSWPPLLPAIKTATVDFAEAASVDNWIHHIEADTGGSVDILVNNAGGVVGQASKPIESVSEADWKSVMDANLTATFHTSKAAVSGMKKAGHGVIVNIGSGASEQPSLTGVQAYCAAKHAVLGLTRQLAHELGPFGIRVNCVAPGFIITNAATRRQWSALGNEGQQALINSIALRRLGEPRDIANSVLLISSDQASFITGQIISVNGGR